MVLGATSNQESDRKIWQVMLSQGVVDLCDLCMFKVCLCLCDTIDVAIV